MAENRVDELEIPGAWHTLDVSGWRGPVLVVGANDSGKSTFARYLYTRLLEPHARVGFLDADIGQSSLGLPATISIALNQDEHEAVFPPRGARRVCFVGSNTPRGCTATILVGLYQALLFSLHAQVQAMVVDTSGFVDPASGGTRLKWAKVALFRPCTVVALQQGQELEPLLAPLRHLPRVRLVELSVCPAVRARTREERRAHRAVSYRQYFEGARRIPLPYRQLAVFPSPHFAPPGRLLALEGRDGFAVALALLERASDNAVWLRTPWSGQGRVAALRLGDLCIDDETFQDTPL
jgi:polynucleotide 5'-hydroxyl-kinase GRC3/NOL9